jgi:hypothetical protein
MYDGRIWWLSEDSLRLVVHNLNSLWENFKILGSTLRMKNESHFILKIRKWVYKVPN